MNKSVKATVLVVDDHPIVLEGMKKVVSGMPEVGEVMVTASSVHAAELIAERTFDVYILDIGIPELSGFDLMKAIREQDAEARVVMNTMHEEVWMVNQMIKCGANAIVLKSSVPDELVKAVRAVLNGKTYTCPRFSSVSRKLNSKLDGLHCNDLPTRRERDVLAALSKGMNTHDIALHLRISENTVETFRKRLLNKFEAKNSTDMVVKAIARGWIKVE